MSWLWCCLTLYSARSVNNAIVARFAVQTSFFPLFSLHNYSENKTFVKNSERERESKKNVENIYRVKRAHKHNCTHDSLIHSRCDLYMSVPMFWLSIDDFIVFVFSFLVLFFVFAPLQYRTSTLKHQLSFIAQHELATGNKAIERDRIYSI